MDKKVTFSMSASDAEQVKKMSEKFDVAQVEIFRTAIKTLLKMKVADQKAMFVKKAKPAPKAKK
jgi:hypothetical protein